MRKEAQLIIFLAVLSLSGAILAAESITVYSHRHYEEDEALFEAFTERSGIEVNVVKASADELIERLKAEGANTPADVLITADAGRLHRAREGGLLRKTESAILEEKIPENLRDPDGHWYGFTKRARVLAYSRERVDPEDLSTYEDLATSEWRGRILVRSSANIYNQSLLASLIAAHGQEKAQTWAQGVRENMSRPPQGSDRDQIRAVAAGLGDIAIVNTYYIGLLASSGNERDRRAAEAIGVFFPNQEGRGTHINVSGGGVVAASSNPDEALRFLEFLVSEEAQKRFPEATFEYPVISGVELPDLLQNWGTFKEDSLNLNLLGKYNNEAVRIFNRVGWK